MSKPALWMLLGSYGLNMRCMMAVYDLHENIEHKVRRRDGESESWWRSKVERGMHYAADFAQHSCSGSEDSGSKESGCQRMILRDDILRERVYRIKESEVGECFVSG